jgi:GNAT superfamily N-acetyltransferase
VQVTIRSGRDDDWPSMQAVFGEAGQAAWRDILPEAALADLSAQSAGKVLGFVCVRASTDEGAAASVGEVDAFYVRPSSWGAGLGRVLLEAATDNLVSSGFEEATLWSEHRNDRPLRIYRAAGWTLDGTERRRTFRDTELLELRYRLVLSAGPL